MPDLQLNDHQRHALLAGFKYIDRLLAEGFAAVSSSGDDGAVFSPVVPDATPVQRKVIGDQVARLRRAIRSALEACAIPAPPPTLSAIWSLRTHFMAVEIALDDLGPRRLRGYGTLDASTAAGVAALLAQIRTTLAELDGYLAVGLGGDLSARLARLDQTAEEGRLLRELERIVTAHGLVEFRPSLAQLVARLEKNWWTVAFVGRVSCGKSSLLNFFLATDVLPTGVTPVTAVPIRIIHGPDSRATVVFASGKPEHVPAGGLGEFASEEKNPGNVRHVADIVLALPAPRLAGEVCLVDTPGLPPAFRPHARARGRGDFGRLAALAHPGSPPRRAPPGSPCVLRGAAGGSVAPVRTRPGPLERTLRRRIDGTIQCASGIRRSDGRPGRTHPPRAGEFRTRS